MKGMSDKMKLW